MIWFNHVRIFPKYFYFAIKKKKICSTEGLIK